MGTLRRDTHESLLAYREATGVTQEQAADLVGVTQAQWSRLETGMSGAKPETARRISRMTGVPMMTLLNFGDESDDSGVVTGGRQKRRAKSLSKLAIGGHRERD